MISSDTYWHPPVGAAPVGPCGVVVGWPVVVTPGVVANVLNYQTLCTLLNFVTYPHLMARPDQRPET